MKKILLFFCILFFVNNAFSQVSNIVEQTWYLRSIVIDDTWHYVPYRETILLNFEGENPNYTANT